MHLRKQLPCYIGTDIVAPCYFYGKHVLAPYCKTANGIGGNKIPLFPKGQQIIPKPNNYLCKTSESYFRAAA